MEDFKLVFDYKSPKEMRKQVSLNTTTPLPKKCPHSENVVCTRCRPDKFPHHLSKSDPISFAKSSKAFRGGGLSHSGGHRF